MPDPDVVDGAILSNAADHLHAVFRAPGRPANTNPATTLSNADPAGDLSGDGGTSGALLHGDCLDVMARLPDSCFRAVVTSPPYNLRNSSGNGMRDGRGGKWEQAARSSTTTNSGCRKGCFRTSRTLSRDFRCAR